jgi:hypothetical protein
MRQIKEVQRQNFIQFTISRSDERYPVIIEVTISCIWLATVLVSFSYDKLYLFLNQDKLFQVCQYCIDYNLRTSILQVLWKDASALEVCGSYCDYLFGEIHDLFDVVPLVEPTDGGPVAFYVEMVICFVSFDICQPLVRQAITLQSRLLLHRWIL